MSPEQDWFSTNAPKADASTDWFAANATVEAKAAKIKAGLATQTQYPSAQERGVPTGTDLRSFPQRLFGAITDTTEDSKYPVDYQTFPQALAPGSPATEGMGFVEALKHSPAAEQIGGAWNEIKSKLTTPSQPIEAPQVNKWLNVPAKDMAHGSNPGQRLMDEKLLAPTKEATKANVSTALNDAGSQLNSYLRGAGAQGVEVDGRTIVDKALSNAKANLRSPTDEVFTKTVDAIKTKIADRFPDLDKLTPEQAHELKVYLGDQIDWRSPERNPINDSLQEIYRGINDEIKNKITGIGDVQKRWGDLYVAHRNLDDAILDDMRGRGTGPNVPTAKSPLEKLKEMGWKAALPATGAAGTIYGLYKKFGEP